MSVNYTDFDKIWASTSPLTPYEFSESQYKEGWNFVGATPPSRQMWDSFMKNADEKIQYLYNHESVPVGHEYFTFNPNIPQGSLPLFGGEYSRETYSALWNWVQEQTGYLKTEAEWQQLYTTNAGNVPYYSDGDGSTTFRVPSLKCWIKGANGNVSEVGSYLEAGLPNITGRLGNLPANTNSQGSATGSGALSWSSASALQNSAYPQPQYARNTYGYDPDFNASNSNPIYGNSTTVQPPSIVGMWLVKAYGVVEETGTIDEQQYLDDRMADLKNVYLPANYVQNTIINLTSAFSINITSGNATHLQSSLLVKKIGNIMQLYVGFNTTTAINVGGTISAIISGVPLPVVPCSFSGYSGSTAVLGILNKSALSMRIIGANLASNATFTVCVMYAVAE